MNSMLSQKIRLMQRPRLPSEPIAEMLHRRRIPPVHLSEVRVASLSTATPMPRGLPDRVPFVGFPECYPLRWVDLRDLLHDSELPPWDSSWTEARLLLQSPSHSHGEISKSGARCRSEVCARLESLQRSS